jgi:hypothetical protein
VLQDTHERSNRATNFFKKKHEEKGRTRGPEINMSDASSPLQVLLLSAENLARSSPPLLLGSIFPKLKQN